MNEKTDESIVKDLSPEQKDNALVLGHYEYTLKYHGVGLKIWVCLLLAFITALISILSTSTLGEESTATVFVFFISILIVMIAIYIFGFWGVLVALLSSLLFCLSIRADWISLLFNVGANTIQAILLWLVFKFSKLDEAVTEKGGIITDYKFLMLAIGVAYSVSSFLFPDYMMYVFFGLTILIAALFSIAEKSPVKILFVLCICFLPSLMGGASDAFSLVVKGGGALQWFDSAVVWTISNTVLFATFGYLILGFLGKFKHVSERWQKGEREPKQTEIKVSTIMFYAATFLWNLLFYIMYFVGWLSFNTASYIFPWVVGNIFFLINMFFTKRNEFGEGTAKDAFNWLEQRAVVAEKNTQMLIAIIAFLLPLCANFLGKITESISFVFILNITAAVVSIGLIWVPKNNIKFMEVIKNTKTIFHLYTLSLLLLNAIMIINTGLSVA